VIEWLGVGLILGVVIGVPWGLWLGERGRRGAAERLLVSGTTQTGRARVLAASPDAELRASAVGVQEAQFVSDEMVDRGAEQLMLEAKESGTELSWAEARDQARSMLLQLMPTSQDDVAALGDQVG
jgi:hypothetical protein